MYIKNVQMKFMEKTMETIAVSNLRASLMTVLKEIERGSTINITSRGKIVAKLVPPDYNIEEAKSRLKEVSRTAVIHDIISPIESNWKALS